MFPSEWLQQFDGKGYMGMYRRAIGDEGARAVAEYLAGNDSVTKVDFSINDFGPDGGAALGDMLSRNATLAEFNLNLNPIKDAGAEGIARGLSSNSSVTTIDLHGDAIGPNGAGALAAALANHPSMTSVSLYSNPLGPDGCAHMSRVLSSRALRELNLGSCAMGAAGAESLFSGGGGAVFGASLEVLSLGANDISDPGALALSAALAAGAPALRDLDVSDNRISADGAAMLARSLAQCPRLASLDVSRNASISAHGAHALCSALAEHAPALESVDLASCSLGDPGLECAVSLLLAGAKGGPRKIGLAGNGIGAAGVLALANAVAAGKTGSLEELDLSDNAIGTEEVRALAQAVRSAAEAGKCGLEDVTLYGNENIDDEAIDELEEAISGMMD